MIDAVAHLLATYSGYVLSVGVFGAILLLNQWTFRSRWHSYPTQAEYLAAHPHSNRAGGVVCHSCGTKALRAGVSGKGGIYRCSWCETELFRLDRVGGHCDIVIEARDGFCGQEKPRFTSRS